MPLCSCGVIPAAIGLKKEGASDGASTGFLISTPQTGIDSIFVSATFLGWPFAIFKVISAFITGILGGIAVNMASENSPVKMDKQETLTSSSSGQNRLKDFTGFVFNELIYGIWKWLVIGILISAAISAFIPENALANSPWITGISGKFIVLLFSLGLYVCATSSVPIAASLVAAGMPVGSALVFLMAGPATNVATIGAVYRTFGKKVLVIYLLTLSTGSILLGQLFDMSFSSPAGDMLHIHHTPSFLKMFLGASFLVLMVYYALSDTLRYISGRKGGKIKSADELALSVQGMTCQACANKVRDSLTSQQGVSAVDVNLDNGLVKIYGVNLNIKALEGAVEKKGYKIVNPLP
jgi:uncharacterized membrane protein YraQ (UPF0718 family)/copper chaperone CopZ